MEHHHRIAPISYVGESATEADYNALGLPVPPETEVTEEVVLRFNSTANRTTPVPGGGGIMTAADLALFYQGLAGNLAQKPWSAETISEATRPHTGDLLNVLTGVTVHRGLGIEVAGDGKRNVRGFGHTNSEHAFGHRGAGGQIGWYDPATGLSFAWLTNGHDRNVLREGRRGIGISTRAAACHQD